MCYRIDMDAANITPPNTLLSEASSPDFLMEWIDHVVTAGTAAVRAHSPVLEMEWKANLRGTPASLCAWLNERFPVSAGWETVPLQDIARIIRAYST
jgi:hypothetical protein